MVIPGRRWVVGREPNQFVIAPFVARRRGKKVGIFDLTALVPLSTPQKNSWKNGWTRRALSSGKT
jgi:hypothetical protein